MVRRAKSEDIPAILNLLLQVDMIHHRGRPDIFKCNVTKYDADELMGIINSDKTPVFVCVDEDDNVMGHAFCIHKQFVDDHVLTDVRTLYIDDICVDEKYRRQRVGSKLYCEVKRYAKEQGFYNITLNVWSCNPAAMEFYQKMGLLPQKVCMEQILE